MPAHIPITDSGLLRLLAWLSPSFPVGAYAYSHGAEYAVECGKIKNHKDAARWISFIIKFGSGRVDADIFITSYLAADEENMQQLLSVACQAAAFKGTSELALESSAQGQAFLNAVLGAWPNELLLTYAKMLEKNKVDPAYGAVLGAASAFAGIGLEASLSAYLHAFSANIASAIVRLVPLGQSDGQKIIAELEPVITIAVPEAIDRDPAETGSAAFMVDMMSMQHETQYSRLFRS